jgi:hypothetical protein
MRIFTFGCSYTGYFWPTWADILLAGNEGVNFGCTGLGNMAIGNRVYQQAMQGFEPDDLVIVSWSTVNREDRSRDGAWRCGGNVYNNAYYDENFLVDHWDDSDALNKTLMMIYFVNETLRGKVNFHQTTMFGIDLMFDEYQQRGIFNYLPELLEQAKILEERYDWLPPLHEEGRAALAVGKKVPVTVTFIETARPRAEHHPTPLMHLEWARQQFPELITAEGEQLAQQYEQLVRKDLRDVGKVGKVWTCDKRNKQLYTNHIYVGNK